MLRLTEGRGVDHILEVKFLPTFTTLCIDTFFIAQVGGPGTFEKSLAAVRYAGYIHIIGVVSQSATTATSVVGPCIGKAIILRGIQIGSVAQ